MPTGDPAQPDPEHAAAPDHHIVTDASPHTQPDVYLSAEFPGTGGLIKQRVEDFIVEELPAYEPCGSGEHIYIFVQKVGMSTSQLVDIVARHFGVRTGDVGFAGMKDKRAITRQVLSIHTPGKKPEDYPTLLHESIQVLWADLHTNKLRRGHLAGNRFAIRIRSAPINGVFPAKRTLEKLEKTGVPNRAGEQRFGMLGNNHLIGRDLLLGRWERACNELLGPASLREQQGGVDPEFQRVSRMLYAEGKYRDALQRLSRDADTELRVMKALADGASHEAALRRMSGLQWDFFLTSLQSAIFNSVLDSRLRDGTLGTLSDGDIAFKHTNGACFTVDAATAELPETAQRVRSLEISPTGPMWGLGMLRPSGATLERELAALAAFGLCEPDFQAYADREAATPRGRDPLRGTRRSLRMPLGYPMIEAGSDEHGLFILCSFELPPGGFATTVLQEVMKSPPPPIPGTVPASSDPSAALQEPDQSS
jgi:tRNA pseudouridine13 synthase